MTIEKWLSDVYQDDYVGKNIWNKEPDGSSQLIAELRGWGAIQQIFKTHKECVEFQDEVGKFIVEAIREKIARLPQQEISDEEIEKFIEENYKPNYIRIFVWEGIKWYREQLKSKQ